jgi:hypothetical protein
MNDARDALESSIVGTGSGKILDFDRFKLVLAKLLLEQGGEVNDLGGISGRGSDAVAQPEGFLGNRPACDLWSDVKAARSTGSLTRQGIQSHLISYVSEWKQA